MLTLIDNHLVSYWSAIDDYLIAERRKCLLGNALETHGYYCAICSFSSAGSIIQKKNKAYGQCLGISNKFVPPLLPLKESTVEDKTVIPLFNTSKTSSVQICTIENLNHFHLNLNHLHLNLNHLHLNFMKTLVSWPW